MGINNYSQIQSTLYPASGTTPQPTLRSADGIIEAYGTVVPVDGTAGYITGAIFKQTDGGANTSAYVNEGSTTSCDFNAVIADVPVAYGTAAGRGPSPEIWDDCPVLDYMVNPQLGMHFFDDIMDGIDVVTAKSAAVAAALGTTGMFGAYTGTTANSIATLATNSQGAAVLSTDTDNESAMIYWPKGGTVAGKVKFTTGKKLWFECRIQVSTVADSISQLFIGFAEEALNSAGALLLINEAGLITTKNYIGFLRTYADGNAMDTEFNTNGGTPVTGTGEVVLEATTWTKLGIYCDGLNVTFYQDGVALATATTTATTDFPDGDELVFYLENMCGGAGTVGTVTLDWIRIAQEY